eukprot:2586445-Rhodomonas_salina.1
MHEERDEREGKNGRARSRQSLRDPDRRDREKQGEPERDRVLTPRVSGLVDRSSEGGKEHRVQRGGGGIEETGASEVGRWG